MIIFGLALNIWFSAVVEILYFAWMRERIGTEREVIDLPPEVQTLADLVAFLVERSAGHKTAFENPELIRAAIDQQHATLDTELGTAREIAFFPPVTGG